MFKIVWPVTKNNNLVNREKAQNIFNDVNESCPTLDNENDFQMHFTVQKYAKAATVS